MTPEYGDVGILPRTEDVEVADRDGLEAVQPREHLQVLLADDLLQRVRRQRIGRHVFVLGQRRRIAVGGRGTREHEPLDAGVARGDQHVERARRRWRDWSVTGSFTERGTDGIAAWCST